MALSDAKARRTRLPCAERVPFGFRLGDVGELVEVPAEQEAIREMVALRAQGKALRATADAV
jgi:putative DNA-invertase from lambdoid prophage Rac